VHTKTVHIICFIIKNPPTVRSTSKIHLWYIRQRRRFLFLVSEKSGVMKENCWTVVLAVVHRVFYSHFILSLKKYDMVLVVKTFLYIIIILCFVSTVQCQILAVGWANPKKLNFFQGFLFFCQHNSTGGGFFILKQIIDFKFYPSGMTSLTSNFTYVWARIRNKFELIINNYI
jgi:hypothetical protein